MTGTLCKSLAVLGWLALAIAARPSAAVCVTGPEVQWVPGSAGNGHFYQVVCADSAVTWEQAHAAAMSSGRHLATLTTTEENAFAFGLTNDQSFWFVNGFNCNDGPWLGGFQPPDSAEPLGGWSWVTGESFAFAAWHTGEPNNFNGQEEDYLAFFNCAGGAVRSAHWNDALASDARLAYVTEWAHSLDVDGDGEVTALTDGLLILRRLFGFTGTTLTTGAVDLVNCTRCDAESIVAFLDSFD